MMTGHVFPALRRCAHMGMTTPALWEAQISLYERIHQPHDSLTFRFSLAKQLHSHLRVDDNSANKQPNKDAMG